MEKGNDLWGWLLGQAIFFAAVLVTTGVLRMVLFGLFWVASLATLLSLLNRPRWGGTEWIGFGAFSSAMITAVLLSSASLSDTVGVVVPVLGLLLVSSIISLIPEPRPVREQRSKKGRVPAQRMLPDVFYAIPGSGKFHRKGCRMLKGRQDVQAFLTEDEARKAGKEPCGICF